MEQIAGTDLEIKKVGSDKTFYDYQLLINFNK